MAGFVGLVIDGQRYLRAGKGLEGQPLTADVKAEVKAALVTARQVLAMHGIDFRQIEDAVWNADERFGPLAAGQQDEPTGGAGGDQESHSVLGRMPGMHWPKEIRSQVELAKRQGIGGDKLAEIALMMMDAELGMAEGVDLTGHPLSGSDKAEIKRAMVEAKQMLNMHGLDLEDLKRGLGWDKGWPKGRNDFGTEAAGQQRGRPPKVTAAMRERIHEVFRELGDGPGFVRRAGEIAAELGLSERTVRDIAYEVSPQRGRGAPRRINLPGADQAAGADGIPEGGDQFSPADQVAEGDADPVAQAARQRLAAVRFVLPMVSEAEAQRIVQGSARFPDEEFNAMIDRMQMSHAEVRGITQDPGTGSNTAAQRAEIDQLLRAHGDAPGVTRLIEQIMQQYGVSNTYVRDRLRAAGLTGEKAGARSKVSPEVRAFVREQLQADGTVWKADLARAVAKKFGVSEGTGRKAVEQSLTAEELAKLKGGGDNTAAGGWRMGAPEFNTVSTKLEAGGFRPPPDGPRSPDGIYPDERPADLIARSLDLSETLLRMRHNVMTGQPMTEPEIAAEKLRADRLREGVGRKREPGQEPTVVERDYELMQHLARQEQALLDQGRDHDGTPLSADRRQEEEVRRYYRRRQIEEMQHKFTVRMDWTDSRGDLSAEERAWRRVDGAIRRRMLMGGSEAAGRMPPERRRRVEDEYADMQQHLERERTMLARGRGVDGQPLSAAARKSLDHAVAFRERQIREMEMKIAGEMEWTANLPMMAEEYPWRMVDYAVRNSRYTWDEPDLLAQAIADAEHAVQIGQGPAGQLSPGEVAALRERLPEAKARLQELGFDAKLPPPRRFADGEAVGKALYTAQKFPSGGMTLHEGTPPAGKLRPDELYIMKTDLGQVLGRGKSGIGGVTLTTLHRMQEFLTILNEPGVTSRLQGMKQMAKPFHPADVSDLERRLPPFRDAVKRLLAAGGREPAATGAERPLAPSVALRTQGPAALIDAGKSPGEVVRAHLDVSDSVLRTGVNPSTGRRLTAVELAAERETNQALRLQADTMPASNDPAGDSAAARDMSPEQKASLSAEINAHHRLSDRQKSYLTEYIAGGRRPPKDHVRADTVSLWHKENKTFADFHDQVRNPQTYAGVTEVRGDDGLTPRERNILAIRKANPQLTGDQARQQAGISPKTLVQMMADENSPFAQAWADLRLRHPRSFHAGWDTIDPATKLTPRQLLHLDTYIQTGNQSQANSEAGGEKRQLLKLAGNDPENARVYLGYLDAIRAHGIAQRGKRKANIPMYVPPKALTDAIAAMHQMDGQGSADGPMLDQAAQDAGFEDAADARSNVRAANGWQGAGRGVVQYYSSPDTQRIARAIKTGDVQAIQEAAQAMVPHVPHGAVLVPIPSSKGDVEANTALAHAIAGLVPGATVSEAIRKTAPTDSLYNTRAAGAPTTGPERLNVEAVPGALDAHGGRPVLFIDNVTTTGATFEAARQALGTGEGLAYAESRQGDVGAQQRAAGLEGPVRNLFDVQTTDTSGVEQAAAARRQQVQQALGLSEADADRVVQGSARMDDTQFGLALKQATEGKAWVSVESEPFRFPPAAGEQPPDGNQDPRPEDQFPTASRWTTLQAGSHAYSSANGLSGIVVEIDGDTAHMLFEEGAGASHQVVEGTAKLADLKLLPDQFDDTHLAAGRQDEEGDPSPFWHQDYDQYLYHVTSPANFTRLLENGRQLRPQGGDSTGAAEDAGKLYFYDSVVEEPVDDSFLGERLQGEDPVMLRVRKEQVPDALQYPSDASDTVATRSAVPDEHLEWWNTTVNRWQPVSNASPAAYGAIRQSLQMQGLGRDMMRWRDGMDLTQADRAVAERILATSTDPQERAAAQQQLGSMQFHQGAWGEFGAETSARAQRMGLSGDLPPQGLRAVTSSVHERFQQVEMNMSDEQVMDFLRQHGEKQFNTIDRTRDDYFRWRAQQIMTDNWRMFGEMAAGRQEDGPAAPPDTTAAAAMSPAPAGVLDPELIKRVDEGIAWNKSEKPTVGKVIDWLRKARNMFQTEALDEHYAVLRMQKDLGGGKQELPVDMDPHLALKRLPYAVPAKIQNRWNRWTEQVIKPLGKLSADYFRYADARSVLWRADSPDEKAWPMSQDDARAIVRAIESGPQAQQFQQAYKAEQSMFNEALHDAADAGLIGDDQLNSILSAYTDENGDMHYIPMYRKATEQVIEQQVRGRRIVDQHNPVQRANKGQEQLQDPIERRIKYLSRMSSVSELNRTGLTLRNLVRALDPDGRYMKKAEPPFFIDPRQPREVALDEMEKLLDGASLDPQASTPFFRPKWAQEPSDTVIAVWDKGVPEYWDVQDPDLFRAITSMDPITTTVVGKVTEYLAGVARKGATISPGFTLANLFRDTFESWVYSKNQVLPGHALLEVARLRAQKDPYIERALRDGIKAGGWLRPERLTVDALQRQANPSKGAVLTPRGLLDLWDHVREQPEFWTRIGEGSLEYKKRLRKEGITDSKALQERIAGGTATEAELQIERSAFVRSLREAERITLDFQRKGRTVRDINRKVPFFSIPFEAGLRTYEAATEHPKVFWTKAILGSIVTGALTAAWSHDDPQYQQASDQERDRYALLSLSSFGSKALLRVPKPQGLPGLAVNLAERSMRAWAHDDPTAFREFWGNTWRDLLPRVSSPPIDLAVMYFTGQAGLEDDYQVVPRDEEGLPPAMQFDSRTSLLARKVGDLTGSSPRKLQWGIERLLPNYSEAFFRLERQLRTATGENLPAGRPEDRAAVGRFISRPGTGKQGRSVDRFYQERDSADTVYSGLREEIGRQTGQEVDMRHLTGRQRTVLTQLQQGFTTEERTLLNRKPRYDKTADAMSALRKRRDQVEGARNLSPAAKRKAMEQINVALTKLADQALQQPKR